MEFPIVIKTKSRYETLFSIRDFEFLLDEAIGEEAVRFFRACVEEGDYEREQRELETKELVLKNAALEARLAHYER